MDQDGGDKEGAQGNQRGSFIYTSMYLCVIARVNLFRVSQDNDTIAGQ